MNNDLKKKISRIVCEKNLCSYMNNTKWNEFINAVKKEMPFQPPFIIKYVTEDVVLENDLEKGNVNYFGNWEGDDFPTPDFYANIEWIKVRPCYLKYRGKLIEPVIIDGTNKFEEILSRYSIPFESINGLYCIYGYR